jgi:micrococcal nuclease
MRKVGGLIDGRLFVQVLLVCLIVGCIHQPDTTHYTEDISGTEDTTSSTEVISSADDTISCREVISSAEDTISCTAVIDGDTFRLETGQPVRLIGIDAPELLQPGGEKSREYLAHLILGKNITLERGSEDRDKYNRLLRFVYIGDLCINEEMIRRGYAEARYLFSDNHTREYYIQLEIEAETARAGLWSANIFQPRSHVNWDCDLPVIAWEDAHTYYNQYVIVEGTIVSTHNTGTVCFLNFHTNYYFAAVIFACDFSGFSDPPEAYYLGRTVYITGIIKEYKGSPEIIVKTPDQIKILT